MSDHGEILEDGSMQFTRILPGPIERAWRWIADADKRAQWLCGGGDIKAAGETIKFDFFHETLTSHDESLPEQYKEMADGVSFDVIVKECNPPTRAVIEWPGARGVPSFVDIRLSPEGENTKLVLIQRGDINMEEFVSAMAGWHTHLGIMIDKLAGKDPKPFWSTHQVYVADYEKRVAR